MKVTSIILVTLMYLPLSALAEDFADGSFVASETPAAPASIEPESNPVPEKREDADDLFGNLATEASASIKDSIKKLSAATKDISAELIPEAQLTKASRTIEIPAHGISQIEIKNQGFPDPEFVESTGNNISVSVTAMADPQNSARAQMLANMISLSGSGENISLVNNISRNSCFQVRSGSDLSIKGSCITRLVIALPKGSAIGVLNNEGETIHGTFHWQNAGAAAKAIEDAFSNRRNSILDSYIKDTQASKKRLQAEDVTAIVNAFFSDDEKLAAFQKLTPMLANGENSKLADAVDDIFSFPNGRRQALRSLIH